jgi:hypothetical protein
MIFCDKSCCLCERKGEIDVNFSGSHKVCLNAHELELSKPCINCLHCKSTLLLVSGFVKCPHCFKAYDQKSLFCGHPACSDCNNVCRICKKFICAVCDQKNQKICSSCIDSVCIMCYNGKIKCIECSRLGCYCTWNSSLCINCQALFCRQCLESTTSIKAEKFNEIDCDKCSFDHICIKCSNQLCLNCHKVENTCETCKNKNCTCSKALSRIDDRERNPELFLKCKICESPLQDFDEPEGSSRTCKTCRNRSIKCQPLPQTFSKDVEPDSNRVIGFFTPCESPLPEKFEMNNKEIKCVFCGEFDKQTIKPCGHVYCAKCVKELCVICDIAYQSCKSKSHEKYQKNLECGHVKCTKCDKTKDGCRKCSRCHECKRSSKTFTTKECSHKLCTKCFNNSSKYNYCASCRNSICKTCGKYSEIRLNLNCKHDKCIPCMNSTTECFQCLFQTEKLKACPIGTELCSRCDQILASIQLYCKHFICKDCAIQIKMENFNYICRKCCLDEKQNKNCIQCKKKCIWKMKANKLLIKKKCCSKTFCAYCLKEKPVLRSCDCKIECKYVKNLLY